MVNLKVSFGKDKKGNDIIVDLKKESLHSILLTGETGTGKGMFHLNLYKQLIEHNTSEELGFVFLDMTRVDFTLWSNPYLYLPVVKDSDHGLNTLEMLGRESILRSQGKADSRKALVIHIEERNMIMADKLRFEKAWLNITEHKNKNNMYIVFSTSSPSSSAFTQLLLITADLKVVYKVSNKIDSEYVLKKGGAENLTSPGEKMIQYKGKIIHSVPFTPDEIAKIQQFDNEMNVLDFSNDSQSFTSKVFNFFRSWSKIPMAYLKVSPGSDEDETDIADALMEEVKNLTYLLEPSENTLSQKDVTDILNIGHDIAQKTYSAIRKDNLGSFPHIKGQCIDKAISAGLNKSLSNVLKKDGVVDFYFGFCSVVGREYGLGTPENIEEIKNSVIRIEK